jgi:hypothetical protein
VTHNIAKIVSELEFSCSDVEKGVEVINQCVKEGLNHYKTEISNFKLNNSIVYSSIPKDIYIF